MRKLKLVGVLVALRWVGCVTCARVDDGEARLEHVVDRLKHELPEPGLTPGEWYLVSLSMAGLAADNLGRREELSWLVDRALTPQVRAFDTHRWGSDALQTLWSDEGHAGYLGHLGLLLALECTEARAPLRQRVLGALERRYRNAPGALIATYPKQIWIPDNAVTLAAVALGAKCDGHAVPAAEWLGRWPRDRSTGLLKFTPHAGPRASGAGWNSFYLHFVDERFAQEEFLRAERTFAFQRVPLLAAWREYPPGVEGRGDIDSGPLVFGLSPSGTGFAIAGATRYDSPARGSMLRTAEAVGLTVPWAGPHYVFAPLVGEAAVLAAKTQKPSRRSGAVETRVR